MGGGEAVNLTIEQVVSIISAIGLSAIVSTIITFVQNNKKNNLDFVTKERSEWRKKLKEILSELSDDTKKESAIIKLKSEINPYGKNMEFKHTKPYYMKEGHIWDLLDSGENVDFDRLAFYIELLLKFDWERSKSEVRFRPIKAINQVIQCLLFFSSIYCIYIIFVNFPNNSNNILHVINLLSSFVVFVFILLQPLITNAIISNPSEKQREQIWVFIVFYAIPSIYVSWNLIYEFNLERSFYIISILLIFAYEISYLYLFYIYEQPYIIEIKRFLRLKSKKRQLGVKLTNQIRNKEDRLNQYEYDTRSINSLNRRLKKLKRKLTTRNRPDMYMLHPILFCKYRKNRKRIVKEVKKIIKEKN